MTRKEHAMLMRNALTPLAALALALLGAGCFGGGGKTALQRSDSAKDSAGDTEMAAASREKRPGIPDDDEVYTPEASMRRDLDALKARESRQARLIEEMRSELSENQGQVAREEKRLAEMRGQITRYEEALGGRTTSVARRPARMVQEDYAYSGDRELPAEYAAVFNRPAAANLAQNRAPESGERQYVIKTNIPYEEFQAMRGPAQPAAAAPKPMRREAGQFAGAPQGFPRPEVAARNQPEPDMGTLLWDPNAPGQPELPGVAAAAPTRQSAVAKAPIETARENMTAMGGGAMANSTARPDAYQDNSYRSYATEVFSPDLYFGKGG